jgi:hypothetical protein
MRVESEKPTRNGGWLHRLRDPLPYVPPPATRPPSQPPNLRALWRRWEMATDYQLLDGLAMSLGVNTDSLQAIGCGWNGRAWAFPMRDEKRELIGIRLRDSHGNKWAVKGSHQGLFIPATTTVSDSPLFIVEGPTDLAAAHTLGLDAIGRPACLGQESMIVAFIRRAQVKRVVIVSDNDQPDRHGIRAGIRGAQKLQSCLPVANCIWVPPTKDIRGFLLAGADKQLVDNLVKDFVWTRGGH